MSQKTAPALRADPNTPASTGTSKRAELDAIVLALFGLAAHITARHKQCCTCPENRRNTQQGG
ncbi:MAG: hypothetical protein ACXWCP_32800, partial [Burkholderiales bacterium]